jgi:hypothetical protein
LGGGHGATLGQQLGSQEVFHEDVPCFRNFGFRVKNPETNVSSDVVMDRRLT